MHKIKRSRVRGSAIATEGRRATLARILGFDAGRDEQVVKFRTRVLGGKLLKPKEVEPWINERVSDAGFSRAGPLILCYQPPRAALVKKPVPRRGCLAELCGLSLTMRDRYTWHPGEATAFILCGDVPPLAKACVRIIQHHPLSALSRIVIEIDPCVSAPEIEDLLRDMRRRILKKSKLRPQQDKALQMAEFAAEHIPLELLWPPDERDEEKEEDRVQRFQREEEDRKKLWREAWRTWNATHKRHYRYDHASTFRVQCEQALQRLLLPEIDCSEILSDFGGNHGEDTSKTSVKQGKTE